MALPGKFYDGNGNEVHLDTLCRREPFWAANQIRNLHKRIDYIEKYRTAIEWLWFFNECKSLLFAFSLVDTVRQSAWYELIKTKDHAWNVYNAIEKGLCKNGNDLENSF